MLHKTRGIVLQSTNYSDKYAIVRIYTEEFGQISYLAPKSKGKKSNISNSIFHALSVLDLEVEHFNLREIHKIKEARVHLPLGSILFNPIKTSISIFLAEFINKVVKDVQTNRTLFNFVYESIRILDLLDKGIANFHLVFMIRLSHFLGFYPDSTGYTNGMFFDLQNGIFTSYKPLHPYFLNPDESTAFALLLRMNYENMYNFSFSRKERVIIINRTLEYYRLHLVDFPELKSLEILQNIFE